MSIRQVEALALPDLVRADTGDQVTPIFRVVAPSDCWIEEKYQREISGRSVRLIAKIVANWNWRAFKPPVAVEVEGRLELIDGQHTAIAAATHGGIDAIPVMIVEAEQLEERASAFVQLNRDRLNVTGSQLHHALAAAGDEAAVKLNRVCAAAGVSVLKNPPAFSKWQSATTIAIKAIQGVIGRRGEAGAERVLSICARAALAPISMDYLRAVEHLLFAPEYRDDMDGDKVLQVLLWQAGAGGPLEDEARRYAVERKLPMWRALASCIFMYRAKRKAA